MKTLIVMVGNIGSGKSTLVKKYAAKGYFVLCPDQLRYMIGAGTYTFNEELEHGIHVAIEELLIYMMHVGVNIIIDETNQSPKIRTKFIRMAHIKEYYVKAIQMPFLSKEESVKRRLQSNHGNTSKETWEMVWERNHKNYQNPIIQEGFDSVEIL